MADKKTALFPGSFDPFTKGHEDIVRRALKLFDEVIIAIGYNSAKSRYFEVEYMVDRVKSAFSPGDNISVIVYNELTADLAKKTDATFLIRGLRNTTDFEYENSISQVNRYLNAELETVFLITSPEYAHISSTIIREVHKYDGDISPFIPYEL
ncbi:pantetheine-phosphate adenylyltransferase [Reichenbachiella carrageenanivorans]|uniref:Phosphopantetheine adenylyltransferase n=1 Tax=Reichenbachiella carrageenanivorans TaxID=2979869 RepID=A0ABY6CW11_9BACT|nr:pantetheine-phosphate adenylyltransferase [Reichenbachiella carrageenanivorans]UXX78101.1 pantetheine-phosphate adenylyltransferase [Reichenbachiella carrageenanivorans]